MRGAGPVPVLLGLGLGACASAQNYPDPDEPRFETRYGNATASAETIRVASFDYIFARGLRPPGPATAGVSADLHDASDHRPVWALLELE